MLAIGVDVASIQRMRETLERSGRLFTGRVFTEREREDSRNHQDAAVYFTEIFAAKEAVFKTFGTDWEEEMSFLDVEIRKGAHGEPVTVLYGRFRELLALKNGKAILISLSWELDAAVAVAAMI